MVRKIVGIALGIICILLAVSLVGAFVYYVPLIGNKNSEISSLTNQISQLAANETNLQNQVDSLNDTLNSLREVYVVVSTDQGRTVFNFSQTLNIYVSLVNPSDQNLTYSYEKYDKILGFRVYSPDSPLSFEHSYASAINMEINVPAKNVYMTSFSYVPNEYLNVTTGNFLISGLWHNPINNQTLYSVNMTITIQ